MDIIKKVFGKQKGQMLISVAQRDGLKPGDLVKLVPVEIKEKQP